MDFGILFNILAENESKKPDQHAIKLDITFTTPRIEILCYSYDSEIEHDVYKIILLEMQICIIFTS